MNISTGDLVTVKLDHSYHPNRKGLLQFAVLNKSFILSDINDPHHLFCVGIYDLVEFNPEEDSSVSIQKDIYKPFHKPSWIK